MSDEYWYYVSRLEDVHPVGTFLIARGRKAWAGTPLSEDLRRLLESHPEDVLYLAECTRRKAENIAEYYAEHPV